MPHLCNDLHLCRAPFLHTFGVHCQALVLVQTLLFFLKLGFLLPWGVLHDLWQASQVT
jgi:hypothetical protein